MFLLVDLSDDGEGIHGLYVVYGVGAYEFMDFDISCIWW